VTPTLPSNMRCRGAPVPPDSVVLRLLDHPRCAGQPSPNAFELKEIGSATALGPVPPAGS
jgi:hypothetical protein